MPYELGQLEYLEVLDLSHNQVEGPIPEEISQLPLLCKYELILLFGLLLATDLICSMQICT